MDATPEYIADAMRAYRLTHAHGAPSLALAAIATIAQHCDEPFAGVARAYLAHAHPAFAAQFARDAPHATQDRALHHTLDHIIDEADR